jgi:glycerol-3-phosphate dehydrogenase (NAD(P)+)
MKLAVVGGGAWGTALACVLAPRFDHVTLWLHEPALAAEIKATRINHIFLPGITIPENIHPETSLQTALDEADTVLSVMPSHVVREVYKQILPHLKPGMQIVSATKGLEAGSLLRMSEVVASVIGPDHSIAALSGPTFALEVAQGNPTAVVVASTNPELTTKIQTQFSGPTFRVYASSDITGVEIGGALKNVIAIGAGISDGLKLGHNALAALITRGLAELTRLAVTLGAQPETLAGLAGLGDLVLTCTSDLSRNRQVGLSLAAGHKLGQILSATPTVAEGVKTTAVAMELAARCRVDLPIAEQMHAVLNLGRVPEEAIGNLMNRTLRNEVDLPVSALAVPRRNYS